MASLRDIRKRIRSVKNTQQITKAMKMVSAAKLRKAQDAIVAARPYARDAGPDDRRPRRSRSEGLAHPLLTSRPVRRVELLLLTSDRGLAGGFNSNVIRRASRFLYENETASTSLQLTTVGRKGNDFFRRRGLEIRKDYAGLYSRLNYAHRRGRSPRSSRAEFLDGEVDAVYLVYNEFVSAITQRSCSPSCSRFERPRARGRPAARRGLRSLVDFKYEPVAAGGAGPAGAPGGGHQASTARCSSRVASEHGARMSAMENATSNASDMIARLTLIYNRTRQAVITKELMEIVSGAEALK